MNKISALSLLLAGIGLITPPAEAVSLSFSPTTGTVGVGQQISFDLIADIGAEEPVVGFDINLDFDPTIVFLTNVVFGSNWSDYGSWSGSNLTSLAFPDPITGNGVLATLTFNGALMGSTFLSVTFDGLDQGFALETPGDFAAVSVQDAYVSTVPEPASVAMFLSGLLVLGALTRRRQAE